MTKFNKYFEAARYLDSLVNLPIKDYLLDKKDRSFYIDRLKWFLNSLNNPHHGFKYVHITGTAGKGTTAATVHQILALAGKKVGSYYSPHPTTAIERIKVNDKYISPDDFADLMEVIKPKMDWAYKKSPYGRPSYFETFLTMAFLYFKKTKCEYAVLEAGLGGTYDATNVIKKPLITAITNVDYDHLDVLGKTLTKIAADKAGIIKKGSIFLTAEQRPHLLKIFSARCKKLKVPMIKVKTEGDGNNFLAKAIAGQLNISESIINQKYEIKSPCRFETVQKKPLVILDGAHNPIKLAYLAERVKAVSRRKLNVIMAMSANKDLPASLGKIVPLADKLILTRFLTIKRRSAYIEDLTRLSKKINKNLPIKTYLDPWQALKAGLKMTKPGDCLLVTGSFFLAGELRTHWIPEEQILTKRSSF